MGDAFSGVSKAVQTVADPFDILGFRANAKAQGDAANAQLAQQQSDRASAMHLAEATPAELANMQNAIRFSENDISRKTKLLASADPALIEAGKNALNLLQGHEANVIAPMRANLARQESKLRERLAAQYGSGYESTTAGQQALQQFNEQSNSSIANAQQNSLGQLLGVVQNTAAQNSNLNTQMNLGQLLGSVQSRQLGALSSNGVDPGLAYRGAMAESSILPKMIQTGAQVVGIVNGIGSMGGGGGAGASSTQSTGANLGATLGNQGIDTSQYGKYY